MANNNSKVLSIRLQKELFEQLENQARIQKLTLSDFVRQELSQVEKRIRDNELLKNKIVILLLQINSAVKEQGENKIGLSKYQELQIHNEKIKEELDEAVGKVSSLVKANENIKDLLDHKDSMLRKYEPDKSTGKEVEPRVEKSDSEIVQDEPIEEQVQDEAVEPEEEIGLFERQELPTDEVPDDDGWSELEE